MIEHYDLFAGIGGFSLALDNVFGKQNTSHIFVERDEFCQLVLKKYWLEAEYHYCIHEFNSHTKHKRLEGSEQDKTARYVGFSGGEHGNQAQVILTGGFPCQPFSQAGRRKGADDDRYLWPAMFESIKLIRPDWVIAENVAGLVTWNEGMVLEQVCSDLESEGYEVQPFIIPACAVNAPHRRDRVWIIGRKNVDDPKSGRCHFCVRQHQRSFQRKINPSSDSNKISRNWNPNWLEVATRLCGIFNGLSAELDEAKLKKYANLAKKITGQDLPHLWHNFQSQKVQWKIGRFDTLQHKDYLFTILWQLTREARGQDDLSFESQEVQEAYLRNVWFDRKFGCSSQGWKYCEQYEEKHRDALSRLSYEVALAAKEVWEGYTKDRTPRLKALGNAIVPQVAEEIFKAILGIETQKARDLYREKFLK